MARMIIHSDNRATDILLKDLGGPSALHDWLQDNGVSGLRVDRTIAQLLGDRRDLWDRRDSATPHAMVDLLGRIYRAELIKPASRNYLLDLMSRCETGKNRMKALLPNGTPVEHKTGTLNGLADDVGFITLPDGRRIAIAIFTRGGSDRPRTIAEAARDDLRRFRQGTHLAVRVRARSHASASAHRRPGQDRPLTRGRTGRTLSETHPLADQGHRAARSRRQNPALRPNSITSSSTNADRHCRRRNWPRSSKAWRESGSARRAS